MLNRGLRTSCATPATIEPISAMVSLWRSCSLRRTVSVTSWKFSTARPAPSPSAASARALTTQVTRVSGSLTSRAAGAPPRSAPTSSPRAAQGSPGPRAASGVSMSLVPARAARVLDGGPVGADDPALRVDHHDAQGQAVERLPPLDRGAAQVGLEPPPVRHVGAGPEDVGHLPGRVEDRPVDPGDQPPVAGAGLPLGLVGRGLIEHGAAATGSDARPPGCASAGRSASQKARPRSSASVHPLVCSQARLKRTIRPCGSTTMTSEATMSSRLSANTRCRSISRSARSLSSSAAARAAKTCSTPSGRTTSSRRRSWIALTMPRTSPVEARSAVPT